MNSRLIGSLAVALLLAGILATPAMAKTSADCGAGFVNGFTGGPGGIPLPYSACSDDAGCQKDWTCMASAPTDIYDRTMESFCMTDNNHCCWKFEKLLTCSGVANCQRPGGSDPANTVSLWCGCTFDVTVTHATSGGDATFTATPNDCSLPPIFYSWDCVGGTLSGSGPSVICTYASDGTYTVQVAVTDSAPDQDGTTGSDSVTISGVGGEICDNGVDDDGDGDIDCDDDDCTDDPACSGEFTVTLSYSPSSPNPEQTVTFTATAGGGTTACRPYSYEFDFGDGSATESVTGVAGTAGTSETKSVTHSYSDEGTYTVKVTVKNCDETETVTDTVAITVSEGGEPPGTGGAGLACETIITGGAIPNAIRDMIKTTLCIIWRIIQGIVTILAALVIALAGLRWLSTDNPEERAKAKRMIASAIVGATIVIIALQLANVLVLQLGWNQFDCTAVGGGVGITQNIVDVACVLFTLIQAIAAIIALVVIVLAGIKWATSDEPEGRAHAKSLMIGAIVGFVIILIAGNFVKAMFFGDDNALMGDFDCGIAEDSIDDIKGQIEDIGCMLFMTAFFSTGILVSLVIVIAGIKWMSSESPEDRSTAKRWLIHALVGMVIVLVASQLIWAMTSVLFGGGLDLGNPYLITCLFKLILHGSFWVLVIQLHVIFCIFVRSMQAVAAVVAALYLTIAGLRLVGTDDPESRTEAKRKIFHVLVGFMITMIALSIVDAISILAMLDALFGDVWLIGTIIGFLSNYLNNEFLCPSVLGEWGGIYFVTQLQFIFCVLIKIIQIVAVILAGIVIMLSGIKWSTSDDLKSRTEAKTRIAYALIGLVVIVLALQVVNVLMGGAVGLQGLWSLSGCQSTSINGDIEDKAMYMGCIIVRIMQACAALISGFVIVIAGIRWMSTDTPEDKSNAKNYIVHALIGLAIVVIALQLVNALVNGTDVTDFNPSCAVPEDIKQAVWGIGCNLIKIIQFVAGLLGTLVIIVGGLTWISSGDNVVKRSRAKTIIIAAIIGIFIILIGLQLANTLVTGTDVLTITCP